MDSGFDFFMCGLCDHLVTPSDYKDAPPALQCKQCDTLFCEGCVNSQMMWVCPNPQCKSKEQPGPIHFKVREVLEAIKVFCPGCKQPKRYNEIWKCYETCGGNVDSHRQDESQVQEHINFNLQKIYGLEVSKKTNFANEIFVLDKERLKIFVYSRLTNTFSEHNLAYEPAQGQQVPVSKSSN